MTITITWINLSSFTICKRSCLEIITWTSFVFLLRVWNWPYTFLLFHVFVLCTSTFARFKWNVDASVCFIPSSLISFHIKVTNYIYRYCLWHNISNRTIQYISNSLSSRINIRMCGLLDLVSKLKCIIFNAISITLIIIIIFVWIFFFLFVFFIIVAKIISCLFFLFCPGFIDNFIYAFTNCIFDGCLNSFG